MTNDRLTTGTKPTMRTKRPARSGPTATAQEDARARPNSCCTTLSDMRNMNATGLRIAAALTAVCYAAGVALFFARGIALPCKVAYPAAVLALSVAATGRRHLLPLGAAFLASALGDAAGAQGAFLAQMGWFGAAHVALIVYFLTRATCRIRLRPALCTAAALGVLLGCIVPGAADPAERTGVLVYGMLLASMCCGAWSSCGPGAGRFRLAALLFVVSDGMIAWHRFVAPIPGRTAAVMGTYYLAQWLFYRTALRAEAVRDAA